MTDKHLALSATAACLMSVLILMGFNPWLSVAIAAALGVVWTIVELVVQEIQGRIRLQKEEGRDG